MSLPPLPLGGVRVSPDIVLVSLLIVGALLRLLAAGRSVGGSADFYPLPGVLSGSHDYAPLVADPWWQFVCGASALLGLLRVDVAHRRYNPHSRDQVRRMVAAIILSTILPVASGLLSGNDR